MINHPVFVAVDTQDCGRARALAQSLASDVGGIKLGLEFFLANGPAGIDDVCVDRPPLFLDLKLHDIPNTVASAVRALSALKHAPAFLTLHAQGGPEMIRAAAQARDEALPQTKLLAVTVLTSLDGEDLAAMGIHGQPLDQVLRLGEMAVSAGADGCVCSPLEVEALREALGQEAALMVPGIRPAGASKGDQKRVMTPAEAVKAGANFLVIGRPITQAPDPEAAAQAISQELGYDAR
ncbi:MAG: orotidine-5'-phosphate decarboxylase [Pseudomonadota bacterium]